jgi:hypothetical protein
MAKPEKPSVPGEVKPEKKARKPRGPNRILRLTEEQINQCEEIAKHLGDPDWGTEVKPMSVAARALTVGLEQLKREVL